MLQNFFKKAMRLIEPVKEANVLIAEIHNEFDTATDRLVKEAKEILKHPQERGQRLQNVGFSSSKSAQDYRMQLKKRKQLDLVNHFMFKYPNNKYISNEDVTKICEKYGLVLGHTLYFIGDVPDKNLSEIESFVFNVGVDCNYELCHCEYYASRYNNKDYKICAPISQFNTDAYRAKVINNRLELKDPIVLFEVTGGYLIISKWGLEAGDEIVINEKMN